MIHPDGRPAGDRRRRLCCLATAALLAAGTVALAQEPDALLIDEEVLPAKVTEVVAGGVLRLASGDLELTLRLPDIRLPQPESDLRERAEALLRRRYEGAAVEAHLRGHGSGDVRSGYALVGGDDPRLDLVEAGLARYCPGHRLNLDLEERARRARSAARGIWSAELNGVLPHCEGGG